MIDDPYFNTPDAFERYARVKSEKMSAGRFSGPVKYSVVIPTFGRADLLKESIDSCLAQDYDGEFEILIADNDPVPDNDTYKLISSYSTKSITYFKNKENIGCIPNFNRCIELASGEYVIMLHTDDMLDSGFMNTVIPMLEKNPDIDMLIPGKRITKNNEVFRQKGLATLSRILRLQKKVIKLNTLDYCYYNITGGPIGIVMKKSQVMESGGFDEDIFPMSDYAFWVRMTKKHNAYYLPMELGTYRFINNISSEKGMQENYIVNEYALISHMIKGAPSEALMTGYLYEYIRYRIRVSELDMDRIFKKATGDVYRFSVANKLKFASALLKFTFSYINRAVKSNIKV